jgi:hypothetical protein
MAIFDQKNEQKIFSCKFFPIFGHQTPGSGTGTVLGSAIRKHAGSGSALNQCGIRNPVNDKSFEEFIQQREE